MRHVVLLALIVALAGCGSVLSPRAPIIEDKVGDSVRTVASAPDYRISYVVKTDPTDARERVRVCAEAPADAGAQFASSFTAGLQGSKAGATLDANATLGMAVAMKQLFRRSQGLQLYRDGAFALCNMYINGVLEKQEYLRELVEFRKDAVALIKEEIPHMSKVTIDPIAVPAAPK